MRIATSPACAASARLSSSAATLSPVLDIGFARPTQCPPSGGGPRIGTARQRPSNRTPRNFSRWISCRRRRYKISAKANISHLKMPTTSAAELEHASENMKRAATGPRDSARRALRRCARELSVFVAFCAMTAVMTWPWVVHLRDAVADRGDPYMIAWTLWWDYHQTFANPLHLFDANVFYPYHYT